MPDYAALATLASGNQVPATEWLKIVNDLQLHQNVETVQPLNNTGGTVTRGYVGVLDDTASNTLIPASMAGDSRKVVVVQEPSVVNGLLVYCQMLGRVSAVNVTGAVALHEALETSATPGYAHQGTGAPFGIALEAWAGPGTSTIQALLIPLMAGGGFPLGDPSATHGPISFHLTGITVNNLIATPGAGKSIYVTRIRAIQNNTTPCLLTAQDTTGPTHVETWPMAGVQGYGFVDEYDPPWKVGANEGLNVQQSATGDIYGSVNFYVAAG